MHCCTLFFIFYFGSEGKKEYLGDFQRIFKEKSLSFTPNLSYYLSLN